MYKSKYANLMQHLMNEHDLILLDSEQQEIENLIDKDLKAINYTSCSEQLKDKKEMTFTEWLELNKYTRHTRDMFLDENGDYYYESLLLKIYKKEYSL